MLFNYEGNSLRSGIYKIENKLNGKVYIGQASRFKERWMNHKSVLKRGSRQCNKYLLNDYRKCFKRLNNDDFLEFSILEVMENSIQEERNQREEWWINYFIENIGRKKVYNVHLKPNTGEMTTFSYTPEETRRKKREANLGSKNPSYGKSPSEETRQKQREKLKGKPVLWTQDLEKKELWKQKISKARKGKKNPNYKSRGFNSKLSYAIVQYDLNHNLIKIFGSIREAGRELNVDTKQIRKNLKSLGKTAYGFIWKYHNKK